jgi:hypothetical protein
VVLSDAGDGGDGDGDEGCEVLYGRAGFLYALLLLRLAADDPRAARDIVRGVGALVSDESLGRVVEEIVRRGKAGAMRLRARGADGGGDTPPLMWRWHGKRYLGSAHGVGESLCLFVCPCVLKCTLGSWDPARPLALP